MPNRNVALSIILTIITCGIYGIYWFIKITDEMNYASGRDYDTGGLLAFIFTLITCGIYSLYWSYKMGEKVDILNQKTTNTGILYLILALLGFHIVVYALVQSELNKCEPV